MRKHFNNLTEAAQRGYLRAGVAAASLLPVLSHAQTDPFDTVMTSATTKVTSYGGALVTLAGVAIAFYIAIKFLKKIPKAA